MQKRRRLESRLNIDNKEERRERTMEKKSYVGRIKNQGSQRVEAPAQSKGKSGKTTKKTGKDLRSK